MGGGIGPNALADYGVTSAKLEAFQARIDGYRRLHTAPRQRINTSAVATQALQDLFQQAMVLIKSGLTG